MITAGEVLKNKRESLGKSLDTISSDTKIQKRFLEYIEKDQYEKFDSDVFASGFIKIYSKYLGLDVEKVLAIYRRSNLQNKPEEKKKVRNFSSFKPKITPQIVAIVTLSIFLLSVVGYIGYQIYKFQTPPQLTVIQPTDGYQSKTGTVLVKGNTESSATITINGLPVETDSLGYFEKELPLNEGINTISITSKKSSNNQLETNKTLKVFFTPTEEVPEKEIIKENKIVLKILQSSSWIKLDIDGENKIAQILEPNTQRDFIFKDTLTLVTGRVQSTQLEIDGKKIDIKSSQNSGVGQITCKITSEELKCE